jgi:predicted nuclease of predicted toxin-antitoxin system
VKFLIDMNLSYRLVASLDKLFPGTAHARNVGLAFEDDRSIWEWAGKNGYTVLTQGRDVVDLAEAYGPPPLVVKIDVGNASNSTILSLLENNKISLEVFETNDEVGYVRVR